MARAQQSLSETEIARRIKSGRGQGHGEHYKPWFHVQDVPSDGRSHRIYSHKTRRVHHLLSDLELAVFLVLEWSSDITDIREQFPLKRDETRALAAEHQLRHPSVRGVDQVMSSDFLVDATTGPDRQFAIQVKPVNELAQPGTIEKLELERRYWQLKQIPWFLVTEEEIDLVIKQNIEWLYPTKNDAAVDPALLAQLPFLSKAFSKAQDSKVIDICKHLDTAYELELGHSLRDVRTLVANGFIKFNINKAFRSVKASELRFCQFEDMEALLHVANQ